MRNSLREHFQNILSVADVKVDGKRVWDIQVNNPLFYQRVFSKGSLGLGEAYMEGWWDCKEIDEFFYRILRSKIDEKTNKMSLIIPIIKSNFFNLQNRAGAEVVNREHYDLNSKLYSSFLDTYMQYTCGYFEGTNNLNEAQENKLDLICRKLKIKKGDRVLDIGCGWGGFAKYAAKNYGCRVTGLSLSKEQVKYAKTFCKGLPVEIKFQDYRDINGQFDKILVCGMIEHVGCKNYHNFMQIVNKNLKDDGLFLLHTIGRNDSSTHADPWIEKYIFPNSMLPSLSQIAQTSEKLFVMEDLHSFGQHYDLTLMAWENNFVKNWNSIKGDYDEKFYRMWRYYLLSCAGAFRSRTLQLWQIVFSKKGIEGGYICPR